MVGPRVLTERRRRSPDKLVRDSLKRANRALATFSEPGAYVRIHASDLKSVCEYAITNEKI